MTRALANCTSEAIDRFRSRRKGNSINEPARVQRVPKEPGSKELVLGQWYEVETPNDCI